MQRALTDSAVGNGAGKAVWGPWLTPGQANQGEQESDDAEHHGAVDDIGKEVRVVVVAGQTSGQR